MSTNQGPINQMGSIHATESYSGTKKEWSTDTGYRFQVNHENKCSVKEARHRTPYCVVPLIQNPINRQIHWDTKQIIACQGGKEEGGVEADNDLLQGKHKYSKIACCDGWTIHEYTKKKLHTLNGWVLKCVHIASECKASWKWLAGGLPQSYFPSPEKTDHFPTTGHWPHHWAWVIFCWESWQVFQATKHPDSLRTVWKA